MIPARRDACGPFSQTRSINPKMDAPSQGIVSSIISRCSRAADIGDGHLSGGKRWTLWACALLAGLFLWIGLFIPVHELAHALVARAFGLPVIAVHLPRMLGIHPFSAFGIRWAPAAKGDPCIVIDWGSSGSGPHSFPAILTYLAGPLSLLVLGFLFFSAFRDRRTGLPFVVALCLVLGLGLMGSAAWDLYPRAPVGETASSDGYKIVEAAKYQVRRLEAGF